MAAHPTLARYLVLQRALDTDVLRALQVSATAVEAELRRLQSSQRVGSMIRTQQLLLSQQAMQAEMARYWSRVGEMTKAAMATAAAEGAESMLDTDLLSRVFGQDDVDYMTRSARASAAQALSTASERISGTSYIPLAESVYDNAALSSGKIDDLVNSAILRGASAAELAADVRDFVNPNTPGGVRYASMRLARTELNNAFHASQIRQAQKDPWTLTVKWWLSGSHPRPDECNEYADSSHFPGGEAGHFRPSEVPAKPHPNCLCFTTPENDDVDEFIRKFEAGQYDEYLEKEMGLPPASVPQAKAAVKQAQMAPSFSKFPTMADNSIESALKANSGSSMEHMINCQKTTLAYEMRRRGINVVAKPGIGGDDPRSIWKNLGTGKVPKMLKGANREALEAAMASAPVGSRFIIDISFKRGMHVFSAEKMPDGTIRYLDGQNGISDASSYFNRDLTDKWGDPIKAWRVDDAVPTSKATWLQKGK